MNTTTSSILGKTIPCQFGVASKIPNGYVAQAIVLQERLSFFGMQYLVERLDPQTQEPNGQLGCAQMKEDGMLVCANFRIVNSDEYGGPWTRERCIDSLLFDPE